MEDREILEACGPDILKIRSECLALVELLKTLTGALQGSVDTHYIEVMEGVLAFAKALPPQLADLYAKVERAK